MSILRAASFAALFLVTAPWGAMADDVTLTARDGSVELNGTLLGYDGEFYRIDTDYGILTVDGSGVTCDGPGCPNLGAFVAEFTISGAQEMNTVLIPALVEGFALRHSYALSREEQAGGVVLYTLFEGDGSQTAARITIKRTSSDEGFADLLGNQADMIVSMREATGRERAMAREAGMGDLRSLRQVRVLALDALVPVVAPGNPVRRLSMTQLMQIYSGQVTNWAELGGEDAPITPYLSDPEVGFGRVFVTGVVRARGGTLSDRVQTHASDGGLTDAVAGDPFGIGITGFSQPGNAEVVTLSGPCGFDLSATPLSIKAEDYPLTTPMYLYLPARRLPKLARDFLRYMRSDAAQFVARRAGFVDQAFTESAVGVQGDRLANAIRAAGPEVKLDELKRIAEVMAEVNRLSLTFRFEGGSVVLDAPSRSNVALISRAIEAGRFDGRAVTLVGFGDGQGSATQNLKIARRRAEVVRRAILAEVEGVAPDLSVDAFGEALPMACDDSAWGRSVNRRVEVWIK
ncbi:substrate-binding domain-containing protein [Aliiroseovarius subalbicans]|uniref:substrate-binding domain-containing protein n=1 Tax=Aliiroseovarius subalbicans TaxID=2925840 RepID=UPI001F570CBC|nr:substrate-binding domain-containing protein [Aliiroseovarius subalbicans]MCI2400102.1 substrate-binding domain-containing protein [Aliiroseovarius subalbicans]